MVVEKGGRSCARQRLYPARTAGRLAAAVSMVLGAAVMPVGLPAAVGATVAAPPACANPLSTWSTAQLVEQMVMVGGQFSDLQASAPAASAGVGGFVLFGQPPAGAGPSIRSGLSALAGDAAAGGNAVPWFATDEEGGTVARLSQVIGALPSARQMATLWTPSQVQANLTTHAAAMRSLGVTMDLAPVLDVASASDTIADESERSFSDDPSTVAVYGSAFAAGLRAAGVVPVIKHFPGLGHASADTDLGPATDPSLSQLQADDLIPFGRATATGVPVVMVGHPSVPGLTGTQPASLSPAAYQYLRNTLHFTGVALTDDLDAGAISGAGYSQSQAAVTAVESGADMAMVDASGWTATVSALEQAVRTGALPVGRVEASVARILVAKSLPVCPTMAIAAVPTGGGYWIAGSGGAVMHFGTATGYGALTGIRLNQPVVGMASTPDGKGYWLVAADGGVFNFGDAHFYGSTGAIRLSRPVVGMAPTPDGGGYWLVAADGGVFAFGDARFFGCAAQIRLSRPVVGMASTPDGKGYWLVAADGGVFSFGDARFYGSAGRIRLNQPVVAMAAGADGGGYWLAAADGGIFAFGDAPFYGSLGATRLAKPVTGVARTPDGLGYWLVGADGGVFNFGDARFYGSGA